MLLAAAASGWAPSGAGCSRAAPGRSSSACGCPRRRRRRRGRRAGTAASVARGRAALALRSPSATRAIEPTPRVHAGAFRAPGRVQDDAEPSGDGILRGASRFYTLSPQQVRARSTLGRSRRHARPSAATGAGASTTPPRLLLLRQEAGVPARETPPVARERKQENRPRESNPHCGN